MSENDKKYIYRSHMGGLYTSDEPIKPEDLYCETCGDSDEYIGTASNSEEAWELLKPLTCCGENDFGLLLLYVMNFLEENFFSKEGMYVVLNAYTVDRYNNIYRFTRSEEVEELPVAYCVCEELKKEVAKALFDYVLYYADCMYVNGYDLEGFTDLNKNLLAYKISIATYFISLKDREDDIEPASGMTYNQAMYIDDGYYGFIEEDALEHDKNVKMGPFCRYVIEKKI